MAGKFHRRDAIIDMVKSRDRINAIRKREGKESHPIVAFWCGCTDDACGGFHRIDESRVEPDAAEADATLKAHSRRVRPRRH